MSSIRAIGAVAAGALLVLAGSNVSGKINRQETKPFSPLIEGVLTKPAVYKDPETGRLIRKGARLLANA